MKTTNWVTISLVTVVFSKKVSENLDGLSSDRVCLILQCGLQLRGRSKGSG